MILFFFNACSSKAGADKGIPMRVQADLETVKQKEPVSGARQPGIGTLIVFMKV